MIEAIREQLKPLYQSGDLLGFSVCSDTGEVIHNETYFSDEVAWQATAPFVSSKRQLSQSGRETHRLTVVLDDAIIIYGQLEQGHAIFILSPDCDLDAAAAVLS